MSQGVLAEGGCGALRRVEQQPFVKAFSLACGAMEKSAHPVESPQQCEARMCLRLNDQHGRCWSVLMSPGTERFIGHYPRLTEFVGATAILHYEFC